ncbi:MAG: hypothetical protein A2664_02300 [Candidatus Taylorbacteria bacterium RIFCSPHIGHO2_01_FULL_46_22b]|uniref:Peptidase M14 domain-containing protein n=1 Tax=Candidatus Taylorbacteria bacterium RIFCSPHIGHO2_01_FULL_46_22b TaxID=1802301 RepID=A0A1G2M5F6_9BACT|nr:MAG: hypothetical protein A2664_02300 [Candidatus Taylorbacteria bacterium RIFCSPHIGHO2_01_FULL_46_22b]
MKKAIIAVIAIIIIAGGIYYFTRSSSQDTTQDQTTNTDTTPAPIVDKTKTVIGKSVQGNDLTAYHFGTGTTTEVLFVGGIHGGYEWNTALVAYELMDYLKTDPSVIPANVSVTVIPVLNPDGLNKTVGTTTRFSASDVPSSQETQIAGRFNANTVDLNRNFDCDWQAEGKWQTKTVSGGTAAFSEPESLAIKNYVEMKKPAAVVVWYSSAGGVFASNCHTGVLPETNKITKVYADASGYPAFQSFDFYEVTGDMVNWLAKNNVPAISVLLTNHTSTEWTKNQAGVKALLQYYAK